MNKKSLVFALVLALGIPMAATAFAQQADGEGCPHARGEGGGPGHHGRRGHHGPERMVERLSERLSLTDAQRAQVTTIVRESHEQMKALRPEGARPPRGAGGEGHARGERPAPSPEQRARFEAIRDQADARISALLNASQRTQFDALKAEMRARHEQRQERREQRRNEREGI